MRCGQTARESISRNTLASAFQQPRIGEVGRWKAFLFDAKSFLSTTIECEQFGGGQVRRQ